MDVGALGGHGQKWVGLIDHGTLKWGLTHKWFDELSRLTELFLYVHSNWTMFKLTFMLFFVFGI